MANSRSALKWIVIALVVLLLIPLVAMLGMMVMGGGMMSQMGGMMNGMRGMSPGIIALCVTWLGLVAATLVFLIVFLARGASHT
jgi:hypothetical protein